MTLPSKKAIREEDITNYEYKMLSHNMLLRYDESKCVECGFCHRVCPVTVSIYDELLKKVNKQATKKDHIEASKKLMKANITLSATLINGLGGGNQPELSERHALESADLVNKICPDDDRIWYIAFLTLMIPPGTVIFKERREGIFQEMNSTEILQELKKFIEKIKFHNNKAECIFRCNHASNYLPIKGILDREKESILSLAHNPLIHILPVVRLSPAEL